MPFKTKSGTHYHMAEGCCGAHIQCDTKGLEPCSICCGGASGATGSPAATSASGQATGGADTESAEQNLGSLSVWSYMTDDGIPYVDNKLMWSDLRSLEFEVDGANVAIPRWAEKAASDGRIGLGECISICATGTSLLELTHMERLGETDDGRGIWFIRGTYAGDKEGYVEANGDEDGGEVYYTWVGLRDRLGLSPEEAPIAVPPYLREEPEASATSRTLGSEAIATAGMAGIDGGMSAPGDMATGDMASALAATRPAGTTYDAWDRQTRDVADLAGIPRSSQGEPTILMGRVGPLYVFETSSVSTGNPNDPNDHFGGWLYDVRTANVVAPDGTNLTSEIERVRGLRDSIGNKQAEFMERCRREAIAISQAHRREVHDAEVGAALEDARRDYEREVVAPWRSGYESWRRDNDARARRMADDMRRSRPESRHRYIDGDVEERMLRAYESKHPRPRPWGPALPEYQRAEADAHEYADDILDDEGWDEDEEYERALADVRRRRDPDGTLGVPEAMRRNYDRSMELLDTWPEAKDLLDERLTWGATVGMPVRTPDGWRRLFGGDRA